MPRSNGFDEELVRLRRCWDEAHRAFNAAPSSERDRAIHAVHASANAYFEHLDRIRLEDYVPAQVPLGREGRTVAKALPSLRLATSR